jgi:hypothetical protein
MIKKVIAAAVVLMVFVNLIIPSAVQGQGPINISNSQAQMNFPLSLNFSAQIQSASNITDVRLRYQVEQMSFANVTSEVFVGVTPSKSLTAKYTLDMQKVGGVPPGTVVDYWWTAKDTSGGSVISSPLKFQVNDNRYKWQNMTQGNVSLYWYQGNATFAQSLMNTAQESLVKLKNDTGASLSKPVSIYIYASAQDLQGAMVYPQEWTGGVAYTNYGIIAIGISTAQLGWGQGAMTHELTHQVIFQMTFNPYNDLPVWLNEGLAMFAEGPLSPTYISQLNAALKNNSVFTVRTLASPFSAFPDKANLSYAESYSFVDYLVTTFGSVKMLQLLETFHQGSDFDPAFQKVFGLDMDGLYSQWTPWVAGHYGN